MSIQLTYVAAAIAGGAAALGHAPFGFWPVAIAGFAAAIWAVVRAARPALAAWLAGACYFGVTLHWIVEPFLVDAARHGWMAPFALIGLAGGLALFWALAGWATKFMWGPRALAFAIALAGAEGLRGHVLTGFPWALPGYIWVDTPLRVSVAYIGSYGLSLVTLVAAALPFAFSRGLPGTVLGAVILGCAAAPDTFFSKEFTQHTAELGRVRVIQPDIPQHEKWDPAHASDHFVKMLDLSQGTPGYSDRHEMLVWPEVAVVTPLDRAGPALQAIGAATGTVFVTGINRRVEGRWRNALVVGDADGSVLEVYDKVHLVPFGEYIPFGIPLLRQLAGTSSNGFVGGERVRLIDTPLGRALPLICYEGIFPRHPFRAGERADYILLITNDAWFGTFAGPRQHYDIARFRAAEHGLPVVRAANRGISAVIGPTGRRDLNQAASGRKSGYVDSVLRKQTEPTVYARTGDMPLFALLIASLLGSVALGFRKRIAPKAAVE